MPMKKSPPELIDRFGRVMDRFPAAELRQMFGFPAAFVGGNLATGLFEDGWMARIPAAELADAIAAGRARQFEPMPGRAMTGYALLPPEVIADDEAIGAWVDRAVAFTATLPPKK